MKKFKKILNYFWAEFCLGLKSWPWVVLLQPACHGLYARGRLLFYLQFHRIKQREALTEEGFWNPKFDWVIVVCSFWLVRRRRESKEIQVKFMDA